MMQMLASAFSSIWSLDLIIKVTQKLGGRELISDADHSFYHGNSFFGSVFLWPSQVMLQGAKRVVVWPYSERRGLYPSAVTTENSDELFLAEGIHRRFDLFPAMRNTEAYEATLATGDLMFVPCKVGERLSVPPAVLPGEVVVF